MVGRRPSVDSLDAKIARLERIVERGVAATQRIEALKARRAEVVALNDARAVAVSAESTPEALASRAAKVDAKLAKLNAERAAIESKRAAIPALKAEVSSLEAQLNS